MNADDIRLIKAEAEKRQQEQYDASRREAERLAAEMRQHIIEHIPARIDEYLREIKEAAKKLKSSYEFTLKGHYRDLEFSLLGPRFQQLGFRVEQGPTRYMPESTSEYYEYDAYWFFEVTIRW